MVLSQPLSTEIGITGHLNNPSGGLFRSGSLLFKIGLRGGGSLVKGAYTGVGTYSIIYGICLMSNFSGFLFSYTISYIKISSIWIGCFKFLYPKWFPFFSILSFLYRMDRGLIALYVECPQLFFRFEFYKCLPQKVLNQNAHLKYYNDSAFQDEKTQFCVH